MKFTLSFSKSTERPNLRFETITPLICNLNTLYKKCCRNTDFLAGSKQILALILLCFKQQDFGKQQCE